MSDEPVKKSDWAVAFVGRLCLIGWVCSILYESFYFVPALRQICLFFGLWACVIALINGVVLLLIRRQGIFLVFVLIAIPPMIHFAIVARNVAIEKKWINAPAAEPDVKSVANENQTS